MSDDEELRLRILELQTRVDEYERQMAVLQSSRAWQATTPLRFAAARVRHAKRLLRGLIARQRSVGIGLFPPPASSLPPACRRLVRELPQNHSETTYAMLEGVTRLPSAPVLVLVHVHYPQLWVEIAEHLFHVPENFDLIVTVTEGAAESCVPEIRKSHPGADVRVVENRGRDMAPLVSLANEGVFSKYSVVLKLHTKRSKHRVDGDRWRASMLDSLLGSSSDAARIILAIRDQRVGVVAAHHGRGGAHLWGANQPLVEALAARVPMEFSLDDLSFAVGSMFWAPAWLLDQLRFLDVRQDDFEFEAGHTDGSLAHAFERFIGLMSAKAGFPVVEVPECVQLSEAATFDVRHVAFFLPQFHQIPENDRWWGPGFTDWDNVVKAQPLFEGHRQPIPVEWSSRYDLSEPDTLRRQAHQVRAAGLSGLVFHYYWFAGRQLLEKPLNNLLSDQTIDLPFALSWANESWTRTWDGRSDQVLIAQSYGDGWADSFFHSVLPSMRDPRYITVQGRPLLLVYRIAELPDVARSVARWRELAVQEGLAGLHVLAVVPSRDFPPLTHEAAGAVDGFVRFPPGSSIGLRPITHRCEGLSRDFSGEVFSYDGAVDGAKVRTAGPLGKPVYPGVMPGWDNTARRGSAAYVFHGSNPMSFHRWLMQADHAASEMESPMVFINAWNEWAEGAHIEPAESDSHGH